MTIPATEPEPSPTTAKPPATIQRIAVGFETRACKCPDCGQDSTETRSQYSDGVEVSWKAHLCGVCLGKKIAAREKGSEAQTREMLLAPLLKQLAIPPYYADVTLTSFRTEDAEPERSTKLGALQRAATSYAGFFPDVPLVTLFRGAPGTGKGHLMWSIARAVVEKHLVTARVCVLSDIVRDLRDAWARDEGAMSESQRLMRYRTVDLLAIDEVSTHAFFGQPQQHLYDLIAWRELQCKPTIITTNHTSAEIASVLGSALASRVAGGETWDFGEGDYRLKLKRERARVA